MILDKLIETIIRTPSGGSMTDENKLDRDFVASNIHQVRADAMVEWFGKKGSIHDLWFQEYTPTFNVPLQTSGDCIVRFKCPPVINLSASRDGFEYVGTVDDLNHFPRNGSGGMKAVYAGHMITGRPGIISWSWSYNSAGFGEIELRGRKILNKVKVLAIFSDPTSLPTFREDKDEYPITEELLPFMIQRLFQLQTKIIVERKADVVSDSQDINNQIPQR